jgi:hypothetical protein
MTYTDHQIIYQSVFNGGTIKRIAILSRVQIALNALCTMSYFHSSCTPPICHTIRRINTAAETDSPQNVHV